jgi:hypothetical protein
MSFLFCSKRAASNQTRYLTDHCRACDQAAQLGGESDGCRWRAIMRAAQPGARGGSGAALPSPHCAPLVDIPGGGAGKANGLIAPLAANYSDAMPFPGLVFSSRQGLNGFCLRLASLSQTMHTRPGFHHLPRVTALQGPAVRQTQLIAAHRSPSARPFPGATGVCMCTRPIHSYQTRRQSKEVTTWT